MFQPGISSDQWTAIGSIGTALAALIALGSLFAAWRATREGEAARIREQVRTFASSIKRAVSLLRDGSPLISAAAHTASSLRHQAGPRATADDLRDLIGDHAAVVTAAVEGWTSSPASAELRSAFADLIAADENLSGDLTVFSPLAGVLRNLVADAYSSTIFINLLSDELAASFRAEHQDDDVEALTRALASHLHGNAAMYFTTRYELALGAIEAFVTTAAAGFAHLESGALGKAARRKTAVEDSPTYTGEMRNELGALAGRLPTATLTSLAGNVDTMEAAISKDAARDRLAQLEAG
jgi:hypothetical protein